MDIFRGKLDFNVIQLGQHYGVHGKGDKKQLQLYDKHSSATKHTQLCILGGYWEIIYFGVYFF